MAGRLRLRPALRRYAHSVQRRAAAPETPWWLAGGIDPENVVAAYQAIGAASQAASYVNLANPGTYDLTVVNTPSWSDVTGWSFASGYFDTGIVPPNDQTWSAIVRFSEGSSTAILLGRYISNQNFYLADGFSSSSTHIYGNGNIKAIIPRLFAGTLAIVGNQGYRNGFNERVLIGSGTGTSTASVFIGGGNTGSGITFPAGNTKIQAAAFFDTVLTPIQVLSVHAAMMALPDDTWSATVDGQLIFDGDSMTSHLTSTYPFAAKESFPTLDYYNFGASGQTCAAMIADADTQIDPLYNAGYDHNIVVEWGGGNDLLLGADAATTYDRIVSYCQGRQAAGFRVVALTLLPRTTFDATKEGYRQTVNTNIRNNWATFADAVADVAANTTIGDEDDASNKTYYSDGTHMTAAGYAIVAGIVADAINTLL